ncbi:Endocytosis and vacuole integrity protein [Xanthoria calcicola]
MVAVPTQEGSTAVHKTASDAYYLLNDICLLTEGSQPQVLGNARLTPEFGLELLESLFVVHIDAIAKHSEYVHIIRARLMPFIIRTLSEKANYNVTVRAFRLLRLLIQKLLPTMIAEIAMATSLVNHLLDPTSSVTWKRVLCLELWRDIHDDPTLIRSLYIQFDLVKENKNLVGDHLAILVRLAAENPALIGLGQRSSGFETHQNIPAEQLAMEAGGLSGTINLPADETSLNKPGISAKWSSVRTSCIDQVDKPEPPILPATYLYSLVLTCINRFSDGLAKFLLPFTVQSDEKPRRKPKPSAKHQNQEAPRTDRHEELTKEPAMAQSTDASIPSERRMPVNPLRLKDHEKFDQIRMSALIVEHCWPALLATSSTFLNASLDSDYYHALIRSVQRFTQVAGVLDLGTPRDAFLTTLAKQAVPSATIVPARTPILGSFTNQQTDDIPNGDESKHGDRRESQSHFSMDMSPRNLLCLRALLNLGTALGPVLHNSWAIIFQCLHQVDVALMATSQRPLTQASVNQTDENETPGIDDLKAERSAVEIAVSRLFESTSSLPNEAFTHALKCLRSLVYRVSGLPMDHTPNQRVSDQLESNPAVPRPRHNRLASVSSVRVTEASTSEERIVILDRTAQVAQYNIARFCQSPSTESGWTILTQLLIDHSCSSAIGADVRIGAARDLDGLISRITSFVGRDVSRNDTIMQCLEALSSAVTFMWESEANKGGLSCSLEIHSIALESLLSILERCGDTLQSNWDLVFSIINSVFKPTYPSATKGKPRLFEVAASASRSPKLARSAFSTSQLICSDFLASLPDRCFLMLLDTLHCFCSQIEDFNTSLTSVALFRNVSDHLQRVDEPQSRPLLDEDVMRCTTDRELVDLGSAQADEISTSVLWMYLILHLARLSLNNRVEIRNSALHTLFGIFDTCGDRLDAEAWATCFRLVFSQLLSAMVTTKVNSLEDSNFRNWNDTAVILVRSISNTFNLSLGTLQGHRALTFVWDQMLAQFALLLKRNSLALGRAIFNSLTENLVEIERLSCTRSISLDATWGFWVDNIPTLDAPQKNVDNNDTLFAYVQYVRQLHSMLPSGFHTDQAAALMVKLKLCIIESAAVVYGSDVDEMTPVQKLVLETLALVPLSAEEILTQLVETVSSLASLAYRTEENNTQKGKTYIALSKAAMGSLDSLAKQPSVRDHASTAYLLALMIQELEVPIRLKYKRQPGGKGVPTWKKATSTLLSILDIDSWGECTGSGKDKQSMWEAIVSISNGIMAGDTDSCESPSAINADEAFDMESFSRLQDVIVPSLGSPSIPDRIRRRYVESLFEHSLIHEPHPDDLARPEQELLDGLRSQHVGRVQELPPKRRSKMAYILVEQLFDLAAVHDGSVQRVRLAQIAAPYLILRVGLVLKAYICDQPLRGLMPQPRSQKREMHHVLQKLTDLNSEPKAIPETSGVQSEYKKHLFLLFGLVTKAMKAAKRDEEMRTALTAVLDAMGTDFGF